MSEKIEIAAITTTQEILGKYVKKPPLTEKLLKKPPFRYLHDIVSTVIRETGFLSDVFNAEEMNSNNVKDKEAKISFLNKLIAAVQTATGQKLNVRSAKIVAGLEVNKTLELLQLIGKAIDEKIVTKKAAEGSRQISDNLLEENKNTITQKDTEKSSTKLDKSQNVKETIKKSPKKSERKSRDANKDTVIKEASEENLKKSNESDVNKNKNSNEKKTKKPETNEVTNSYRNVGKSNQDLKNASDRNVNEKKKTITKIKEGAKILQLGKKSEKTGAAIIEVKNANSVGKNKVPFMKNVLEKKNGTDKLIVSQKLSLKENSQNDLDSVKNSESDAKEKIEPSKTITNRINSDVVDQDGVQESVSDSNTVQNTKKVNEVRENEIEKPKPIVKTNEHFESELKKLEKLNQKQESEAIQRPTSARPGSRKSIKPNSGVESVGPLGSSDKATIPLKNKIPASIKPGTVSRPPSARPGAPRIRDRSEVSVTEGSDIRESPVHVIEESEQDQTVDDKDSFIIVESESIPSTTNEAEIMNDAEQGQLVHQILQTQKELHGGINAESSKKQLLIECENNRKSSSDVVLKETEKVRESIQTLTSAANPLGKLFDFLQEDVDEMLRELQHWKNVNDNLHKQQMAELESNKTLLQPLLKQLSDIENDIREEQLQIGNIKIMILNNDEKILRLTTKVPVRTRIK